MSTQLLLALLAQAWTLLERGQSLSLGVDRSGPPLVLGLGLWGCWGWGWGCGREGAGVSSGCWPFSSSSSSSSSSSLSLSALSITIPPVFLPWRWTVSVPGPMSHPLFFSSGLLCVLVHSAVLAIRAACRVDSALAVIQGWGGRDTVNTPLLSSSSSLYADLTALQRQALGLDQFTHLDWVLWVVMLLLPLVGAVVGLMDAADDGVGYKRLLHFLRLEFDTRLGMHSPR